MTVKEQCVAVIRKIDAKNSYRGGTMKYSHSLGDVTPVIYGGFLVDDTTGEAIFWDEPANTQQVECYRFTVGKDAYEDLNWVGLDGWRGVASFIGVATLDLLDMARDPDITERARVYEAVGRYFGFINLNGDGPETYHCTQLGAMYPK